MQLDLEDIVIDTNTLKHVGNASCDCSEAAYKLLTSVLHSNCVICVDGKCHEDVGENESIICHEYKTHMNEQSLTFAQTFLATMYSDKRVKEISKYPGPSKKKIIMHYIANKRDRAFVGVAYNSNDKLLASHDFDDFKKEIRRMFKSKLKVRILCSDQICDGKIGCSSTCSKL